MQQVQQLRKLSVARRGWSGWHELFGKDSRTFFLFASPWIIGFLIFTAYPMLASAYYSLTSYKVTLQPKWVGFDNYAYLLTKDINFKLALTNSVFYTAFSVPLGIIVSMLLASLINQKKIVRGLTVWRSLFYLPAILPAVASSFMFQWMFSYRYGPISAVFRFFGAQPINFFTTSTAQWIIIFFSLWGFGPGMIIFLAGLQGIPPVLYEAASIDGANKLQSFRHVTLPGISPVIFFQFTNGLIGAMQMFQVAWFMDSLPQQRAIFLGTLVYGNAFGGTGVGTAGGMGYASAVAWVIFAIVMLITALNFAGSRFWVHYEQI